MGERGQAKITQALKSQLHREEALLDVVVELEPDPQGPATAPEMRSAFAESVRPVSAAIDSYGGEILDEVWLNRTLRARMPAAKVAELGDLEEVAVLDVPGQVERD
jgi:hypothetical protein